MSGTQIGVSTTQIVAAPVNIGYAPAEGSKVMTVNLFWNALYYSGVAIEPIVAQINLYQQAQIQLFTKCQSIFIDNSSVPYPVVVQSVETGQTIRVNAFTQGMYPLLAATNPIFTVTLFIQPDPNGGQSNGACTTNLYFLNTPQKFYENTAQTRPWTYSAQLTLTNVATPFLLTDTMPSSAGGQGLQGFGGPIFKRIKSMSFTIQPTTAFSAVTPEVFLLLDQNGAASCAVQRLIYPVGQIAQSFGFNFGAGFIQRNPGANFAVQINGSLPPAGNFVVSMQGYGDDVWIA